ncbi:MAG: hypothetical protein WDN23_06375 [Edaphobacter sp.]
MVGIEIENGPGVEISSGQILEQLDLLVRDQAFRSSKRSVAFLRYVVEQTISGSADQIKERTIGVEVFEREPSYDTNLDHVVRTAATELRKRLAIYYGEESHRSELRISLTPGSYIPRFTLPMHAQSSVSEPEVTSGVVVVAPHTDRLNKEIHPEPLEKRPPGWKMAGGRPSRFSLAIALSAALLVAGFTGYRWLHRETAQDLFWRPVLDTPGSVLLAVGDVPNGPPMPSAPGVDGDFPTPILRSTTSPTVPFADAVTIARVVGALEANGKKVLIRRESASSFSDLREGPVVLIGAFNNEWSLRLTHPLRYSLALDAEKHLIYIKDVKDPTSRSWSWRTDQSPIHHVGAYSPVLKDYALISRIRNSETGHVVVAVGGLYTYGTEAAGEFLTDPSLMQAIAKAIQLDSSHQNLQIVLETTVTDDTPGPPKVIAVSVE